VLTAPIEELGVRRPAEDGRPVGGCSHVMRGFDEQPVGDVGLCGHLVGQVLRDLPRTAVIRPRLSRDTHGRSSSWIVVGQVFPGRA